MFLRGCDLDSAQRRITRVMGVLRVALVTTLAALAAAAPSQAAPSRLVTFGSCAALTSYAKAHAARFVTAYGFGSGGVFRAGVPGAPVTAAPTATADGAAKQQGVDYSGTNVQETGVDEPDMVKTDGNTLFAIANGQLESVDVSGKTPRLLDTLQLENGWSAQLLLFDTHLLVLSRGGYWIEPLPAMAARMMPPYASSS